MKYFFGFLVSIGLIILVVVMVLRGFSGDGPIKNKTSLGDYATTDAVVQMTVDGPIIAEADHRAYRITVGNSQVTVEALKGYQYETIENKFFTSNQEAYSNFLRAIDNAGFSRGNEKLKDQDPRGVCAKGDRFSFKILNGATEVQNYWGTSCGGHGNFKGNISEVKSLFMRQIPGPDKRIVNQLGI